MRGFVFSVKSRENLKTSGYIVLFFLIQVYAVSKPWPAHYDFYSSNVMHSTSAKQYVTYEASEQKDKRLSN